MDNKNIVEHKKVWFFIKVILYIIVVIPLSIGLTYIIFEIINLMKGLVGSMGEDHIKAFNNSDTIKEYMNTSFNALTVIVTGTLTFLIYGANERSSKISAQIAKIEEDRDNNNLEEAAFFAYSNIVTILDKLLANLIKMQNGVKDFEDIYFLTKLDYLKSLSKLKSQMRKKDIDILVMLYDDMLDLSKIIYAYDGNKNKIDLKLKKIFKEDFLDYCYLFNCDVGLFISKREIINAVQGILFLYEKKDNIIDIRNSRYSINIETENEYIETLRNNGELIYEYSYSRDSIIKFKIKKTSINMNLVSDLFDKYLNYSEFAIIYKDIEEFIDKDKFLYAEKNEYGIMNYYYRESIIDLNIDNTKLDFKGVYVISGEKDDLKFYFEALVDDENSNIVLKYSDVEYKIEINKYDAIFDLNGINISKYSGYKNLIFRMKLEDCNDNVGDGIIKSDTGKTIYNGAISTDGKKNGFGTQFYDNGNILYIGNFENDSYNKFGKYYAKNGKLMLSGEFNSGRFFNGACNEFVANYATSNIKEQICSRLNIDWYNNSNRDLYNLELNFEGTLANGAPTGIGYIRYKSKLFRTDFNSEESCQELLSNIKSIDDKDKAKSTSILVPIWLDN